jgi:FAD/FMN-containing dehydrogenase
VRHTGGALGRGGQDHGALHRLPGSYLSFAVGMVVDEASAAATDADLERVIGALRPYHAGGYLNFEETETEPAGFWSPDTYRRLRELRAAVDPNELFRANHAIPPAGRDA